jgi:hypothetical protein
MLEAQRGQYIEGIYEHINAAGERMNTGIQTQVMLAATQAFAHNASIIIVVGLLRRGVQAVPGAANVSGADTKKRFCSAVVSTLSM